MSQELPYVLTFRVSEEEYEQFRKVQKIHHETRSGMLKKIFSNGLSFSLSNEYLSQVLKEDERHLTIRELERTEELELLKARIAKKKLLVQAIKKQRKAETERVALEDMRKKYHIYNAHLQIPNLYTHLTDESFKDKPFWGLDARLREIHSNRNVCGEVIDEITHLVGCGDAELIPLDEQGTTYKIVPNGGSR